MPGFASGGPEVAVDEAWRSTIGRSLHNERERLGVSIEELASRLKLRASFVAAVEQGRGADHMDEVYEMAHIRAIAEILNVDVEIVE